MNNTYTKLAETNDLKPGQMMRVDIDQRRILLANVDGNFYATDDTCTHEDASLAMGSLRCDLVKCPLHGSRFNIRTGEVLDEPADEPLKTYTLQMEGDDIFIDLS